MGKNNTESELVNIKIGNEYYPIRIVKYKVGNDTYILGTTHTNLSVGELKKLYKKRWEIETQFDFAKHTMSLDGIRSKSINRIKQDIAVHQLILTVCYYIHNRIMLLQTLNMFALKKIKLIRQAQ